MPTGKIVFVLRTADNALPINNGSITVTNQRGETVFYDFITAVNSGITRTAVLEAPPKSISLNSGESTPLPYSLFNIDVRAEGNYRMRITGVQVFDGTTASLPIDLIPLPQGETDPDSEEIILIAIPEHILRSALPQAEPQDLPSAAIPAVNIGEGVYIPETVTVHLGAPDDNSAQNVTVAFADYIKNVASSEIYPTWPEESLRANILAQISLTLNRIYTEWYRSRGYNFDITNNTAYDQAFVYGRNIFDEIGVIVDEVFNRYLSRPNRIEPLFASYCDGTTTTCAGLSQWGTVALAEDGQTSEDILGFYYGDININETDDIRTPEESYPGTPLSQGAKGDDVRILQEQLNRIAVNFPQLPLITVNGVYDEGTVNTVREFQRLFILPITGVTDRATWYRVSQIYGSVKRLAELTSEGQRAVYNQQLYPGEPIKNGSRGSEVQEVQFYLQRISRFNPMVQAPVLDGIFGADTRDAVISFQRAYGLEPTGIVDEAVWSRLVSVYNGTQDNVEEPNNGLTPVPYPNAPVSQGAKGEYVKYLQQALNIINSIFVTIPQIAEDGVFGNATAGAVNAFNLIFGLPQNGIADQAVWEQINRILTAVQRQCIFAMGEFNGALDYPNTVLSVGSMGENVVYVQNGINRINQAIPYVSAVEADGRYGSITAESVGRLQRIFGLTETRTVNESTWLLINYISSAIEKGCLPIRAQAATAAAVKTIPEPKIWSLKELMRENGINVGAGPLFGLKSRKALAKWQTEQGLDPTGLPNKETRDMLFEKYSAKM